MKKVTTLEAKKLATKKMNRQRVMLAKVSQTEDEEEVAMNMTPHLLPMPVAVMGM